MGVELHPTGRHGPMNHLGSHDLHPLILQSYLESSGVVIIAPLDRARGLPIFSYGRAGNHPFQRAAQSALSDSCENTLESIRDDLRTYYTKFVPETCSQLFGLSESPDIAVRSPCAMVMPWSGRTPDEWQEHVKKTVVRENAAVGLNAGIESGWAWIGPVKQEKLEVEARRLSTVLESILVNGYKRHDGAGGDIMAEVLVNEEGDWVWQSTTGQHRAAVVGALQWAQVPIRVKRIIRREDVAYWPNVANGCFSRGDAVGVFDAIFDGQFSHITESLGELTDA